ncbi:MAG: family 78 glycoside hydrolase catalytic domain [Chitinophaga sp.]|uniref:alpha-L-rhamnosidase n=1 Tax=Chitinophaga sp. TaxID=1869181 RepID=UPI0025B98D4F|nr:alpha-L-rhamnosidase [Chitinophaga sp.]MBV8253609.1 family 78 glycoside hydrolase catalytic domain [Chitinophaga sp.]
MLQVLKYLPAFLLGCCLVTANAQQPTTTHLRCEYLSQPLGIDNPHPRLSWEGVTNSTSYTVQVRYQDSLVWTATTPNNRIVYNGPALQPFTSYDWMVASADNTSRSCSTFETGMMNAKNWKGVWISDNHPSDFKAAPLFRKSFVSLKKITSARAYISAAGLYELYINGHRIGHHLLDPMFTRYDKRLLYVTYDVTQALQQNENVVGVILGNGWYNLQSTAVWNFDKAPWRNRPTFCMDLHITYNDGTSTIVSTGPDWKTSTADITFNSIYTGEHQDLRLAQPGWDAPGFNDHEWTSAQIRKAPAPVITAQTMLPIGVDTILPATTIRSFSDTNWVFSLGQNIAGVSSIMLDGPAGTVVQLKHGEQLYPNGHVDQSNIDIHYRPTDHLDPFQTDIYILDGKGPHQFTPHFNYKGFQYVEVTSSRPLRLTKESLHGIRIHSLVPIAGGLHTSNPLLNQIWQATNNSYLSNLYGYPTDCPQREKNGWTGDAHIASETGLYNFDGITVYEKWMNDHLDEQQANGVFPAIIPTGGWGYEWGNGPDWTSTIAIIPWNLYLYDGDTTSLSHCYSAIKRYVDQITARSPGGLCHWGLGDWVPVKSKTPVTFTSTAYYYADVCILAKAAKILGHKVDYQHYTRLAQSIKDAFNDKYLDPLTGVYDQGFQTEQSVALYWGLVPDTLVSWVAAALAQRVVTDHYQLDVGLLGSKTILNALSENGYHNIAYRLASANKEPSWGWWMEKGATTLYENWALQGKSDLSRNHIMFGEIGAWMYKQLAGIKPDENHPGFKHIIIEPKIPVNLDSLEAWHQTPYGKVMVKWKKLKQGVELRINIPANTTATFRMQAADRTNVYANGKLLENESGYHTLEIRNPGLQYLILMQQ